VNRSLLDPIPRQLSTQALAVLVALVICGTGVAVSHYLDSDPGVHKRADGVIHAAPSQSEVEWRPQAPARPSTWGGMISTTGTGSGSAVLPECSSASDHSTAKQRGPTTTCGGPSRDEAQPTLSRLPSQGT
jgi:hypothetical protein